MMLGVILDIKNFSANECGIFKLTCTTKYIDKFVPSPIWDYYGLDIEKLDHLFGCFLCELRLYFVDGTRRASELGNVRALNTFLLGCISLFMPLKVSIWKDSISKRMPVKLRQLNLTAFDYGRKEIKS